MAAYTSVRSGDWNDPATWGGGGYPSIAGDTFQINNGHVVTYNVNSAVQLGNGTVKTGGTLQFSLAMSTRLAFAHSILTLETGSKFYIGTAETAGNFLPSPYTAIVEWNCTVNAAVLFHKVGNADVRCFGDSNFQPTRMIKLASDWTAGKTFTVAGDVSLHWKIGDEVIVERFVSPATAGSIANYLFQGTIAGVALNGANTDVTVNESFPGWTLPAGGWVVNLNSGNIIFRKVGAVSTKYTNNSLAPSMSIGGNVTENQAVPTYFHNCIFHGIYALTATHNIFAKRCVFRNQTYAVRNSYAMWGVEDAIAFSLNYFVYGIRTGYFKNIYIIGGQFGAYLYNVIFDGGIGFSSGSITDGIGGYDIKVKNWTFRSLYGYSCSYHTPTTKFENCYFYSTFGIIGCNGGPILERCTINYDEDGVIRENDNDFYYDYGCAGMKAKDCKIRWRSGATDPSTDGKRNAYYQHNQKNYCFHNFNQVEGDHRIYGCYGSAYRAASVYKSASHSLRIVPLSLCGENSYMGSKTTPFNFIPVEWTEHAVPASAQHRRVYVRGSGWSVFPTAAQLYVEVEYYNAAGAWTTTTLKSTEVLTSNGTWLALTLDFTPARVGPVTYRVVLAKYEAGASVYLDHALYYSATAFVEATFDWGESVLPAQRVTLPDAYLDTALSADASAGLAVAVEDPDGINLEV